MEGFPFPQILSAGIFDSSIAEKDVTQSLPRHIKIYQIEIPIENGGAFYIDSAEYPITPNIIVCTKPGQLRYTRFPLRCLYIHIAPDDGLVCKYLSQLPDITEPEQISKYYQQLSDISMSYLFPKPGNDIYIASRLLRFVHSLFLEKGDTLPENRTANPLLIRGLSYMNTHCLENITIADVAQWVNVSQIHFQRLFSNTFGISPYQYLLEKRLETGKKLLLTTTASLTEIAAATGFSSQSHFGAAFKKATGKTPLQYRREMLNTNM